MPWNVLITTPMKQEREAIEKLQKYGRFKKTPFKGVLLGKVKDQKEFFETVSAVFKSPPFERAIPLSAAFEFEPERLLDVLKRKIEPLTEQIADGEKWDVSVERRGLKEAISGQEVEESLRSHVEGLLKAQGKECKLDWEDPDKVITVQTVGKTCGMGLITREMRRKWPFVRPE